MKNKMFFETLARSFNFSLKCQIKELFVTFWPSSSKLFLLSGNFIKYKTFIDILATSSTSQILHKIYKVVCIVKNYFIHSGSRDLYASSSVCLFVCLYLYLVFCQSVGLVVCLLICLVVNVLWTVCPCFPVIWQYLFLARFSELL